MRRRAFAALLLLGLAGCGIYGKPQRSSSARAEPEASAPAAAASDENCKDGDQPQ